MKISRFVFSLILVVSSRSQACSQASAVDMLANLNADIKKVQNGCVSISVKFKSAVKDDTSRAAGVLYFFENRNATDTIKHFLLKRDSGTWLAYDGEKFYEIDHDKKVVYFDNVSPANGVRSLMKSKGRVDMLFFLPYLYCHREPIRWQKSTFVCFVDTIGEHTNQGVKSVVTLDSFENEYKISQSDPPFIRKILQYDISTIAERPSLLKRSEWIYFVHSPQYTEYSISLIKPLDAHATIESVLNIDSLVSEKYDFRVRETSKLGGDQFQPAVDVGDTLPNILLKDLDNRDVRLFDVQDDLIVLDFWYRGCYPCLLAFPAIESFYNQYSSRKVAVFGVNSFDKNTKGLREFLGFRKVTYPTLMDENNGLGKRLGIKSHPCIMVIEARTRRILWIHRGYSENLEKELVQVVAGYLNHKK